MENNQKNRVECYLPCIQFHSGMEFTKEEMSHRVEILGKMVQALIDYISEKEGVQLGIMSISTARGIEFEIYK